MKRVLFLLIIFHFFHYETPAQDYLEFSPIGTFKTNLFGQGAAEISAFDPSTARVFFTNASENTLKVLNISDPMMPELIQTIDLTPYGGGVNSVAVHSGIVAAAVEASVKTDSGSVVFFDTNGNFLRAIQVGALPDMVVFSNDGKKVLTANEGEPSSDYTIDPEGSISVIDITNGLEQAVINHIGFSSMNDKKLYLINKGIRIFGPNASVTQDLEPEYIAISQDDSLAYVTLQENNAVAVIDIKNAILLDILPLGFKDHAAGKPILTEYVLNELVLDWPDIGKPVYDGGQPTVQLGGFSGLYYDAAASDEIHHVFYTVPDRGPNDEAVDKSLVDQEDTPANLRPFKLPDYQARFVKFVLNTLTGNVVMIDQVPLRRTMTTIDGEKVEMPITGKGNVIGFDEIPVTYADDKTIYRNPDYSSNGEKYHELPYDPFGGDFEGILKDKFGNFWMCDEYRPSIYKFDSTGMLIDRYVPDGTADLGIIPLEPGFFGSETLPKVYRKRRDNRGFEAIAYDSSSHIIYAFIQSPIESPNNSVRNKTDVIRILGIDGNTGVPVEEYVYLLERNQESGIGLSRTDKIGDAVYCGNKKFMVLERDSSVPNDGNEGHKYIFEIDLSAATNIIDLPIASKLLSDGPEDPTLEMLSYIQLDSMKIKPVFKRKVLNLPSIGYLPSDKPEGLALLPNGNLAVLNDNDFGLAGAGISDKSVLGIISFDKNFGLDASNEDETINITNYPVLGMLLPDAIETFSHNGGLFYITANEGDSRDYEDDANYIEEERVRNLELDTLQFPQFNDLQDSKNLGRLKVTIENGDLNQDGLFERLFSFGGRSFSIFDQFGNLVFDSGDDFERITSQLLPENFNSDNEENGSFDNRSDDKGPEPEAIEIADYNGIRYAFIGMERIGGVMIYDISNPFAPKFVDYFNNRNFDVDATSEDAGDLGVENIRFIDSDDSPTGKPLLITANEVSGTISIFGSEITIIDVDNNLSGENLWKIFPNPTYDGIFTNVVSDYAIISPLGKVLSIQRQTQKIETNSLPAGTYWVRDLKNYRTKPLVVLN